MVVLRLWVIGNRYKLSKNSYGQPHAPLGAVLRPVIVALILFNAKYGLKPIVYGDRHSRD
ncbi:MAG: hypothetical protein AAGF83_04490 [Cyanobacteria bacterium P01_G01_bin.67]